ncbi:MULTISPECIES: hypothetical protein [Bacillaceae]|uniref:Uncharacterized protein n=1 Tax=Evansella alkalicola TaxID=745819 RepID=A0ABS6JXL1_9BACI|nr:MULTISPECIES: hypothetical protein [Bacillaceae]MBU9723319.1 hypothetical protein [Bacillus alkalicola]
MDKETQETFGNKNNSLNGVTVAGMLSLGVILFIVGTFIYSVYYKENALLISDSPNNSNTIEIVEIGKPADFRGHQIRLKHKWSHFDLRFDYRGKQITERDIQVSWETDGKANIYIDTSELLPIVIHFNSGTSPIFQVGEVEPSFFPFMREESPNHQNIIEFRETGFRNFSVLRIYYGDIGSNLESFVEHIPSDFYTLDNFKVEWVHDELVLIDVMRKSDEDEWYIEETLKIDFSKE